MDETRPASEALPASDTDAAVSGASRAYTFAIFNGLSSQIILGSPMVLYAKTLGASATVLGLIAGMMPLLVIFQIPAAQYVPRVGYKPFMLRGWSTRTAFIFGIAALPIVAAFLDAPTRLVLLLILLFLYNLSRGITSGAWLPWITELIPPHLRGGYLVREQACVNLAGAISFSLAAAALGRDARPWQFAIVFGFSAVTGVISLRCLKRIPDRPPPPEDKTATGPVPWREIAAFPPFRKILRASIAWSLAYGGMTTFVVSFLRAQSMLSEATILFGMAIYFVGGLASLWVAASRLDRLGSKPALEGVMVLCGVVTIGWCLQAGGVLPPALGTVAVLLFLMGLGNALFSAANFRLAMLAVPRMGRSHFFALFSVVWNLALGIAPVGWGLVIDFVGTWEASMFGFVWNRFSVFFGLVVMAFALAFFFMRRLDEPAAARMKVLFRELIVEEPKKALARLWMGE